jgi:serine/threonine protein kinase
MSESRAAPGPSQDRPASAPPSPELVTDLFSARTDGSGDDTPTIISKMPPAADVAATSLRGRHLAHFELIEPIGVGGMAAVIRARDLHLDRSVALKILPPEMANDAENIRRFHQEARAAARLDHENIARVFFCGEDQRLHFIAFEFVEGENLRVILEHRGRLPVPEAVHYLLQVATGLAHAAARGVVHRDIKPSNIIVTANGRAKLVDMGLARSLEPHADHGLTQSGVTLGTFDYISPEQALEPRDADVRSDIYSLGCTFYHLLTGQPPVPEGTAARKLNHHQHVAPVDPRQLNPAIPDDVAAILARMMAKDPKDRYQRAEHLVQHLIQVAQKLGAVSEAPDGVLFVDAPLPSPPRKRPLLMAGLAVLALAGLIAVLSLAPTEVPRSNQSDDADGPPVKPPTEVGDLRPDRPHKDRQPPAAVDQVSVPSERELIEACADPRIEGIKVKKDLDLSPEKLRAEGLTTGLIVGDRAKRDGEPKRQRHLVIESENPSQPCTIRVGAAGRWERGEAWAGLTFVDCHVTLRHLRFEIDGKLPAGPDAGLAALAFWGGRYQISNCWFVQKDVAPPAVLRADPQLPVAAIAVYRSGGERPEIRLDECYFQAGQAAVALTGPAWVSAENCAFGPHAALFHLRGGSQRDDTKLTLKRCSTFVVDGPAFRLDGTAGCRLEVKYSVFSRPGENPGAGGPQPDLIFQANSAEPNVCYVGQRNVYHNLNAFWVRRTPDGKRSLSDYRNHDNFLREVRTVGGKDLAAEVLAASASPWVADDPLAQLASPARAFQLVMRMPELRTEDDLMMVGIQKLPEALYPDRLKPTRKTTNPIQVARRKVKIVDPDPRATTGDGVYHSLAGAVGDAEPGDEIQIKYTGEVAIMPIALDKQDVKLTIKPYPGHHPIITLNEKANQLEAAFFRLHDGQVHFEDLELQFKPNKQRELQTLLQMTGNGRCTFRKCVLTLLEGDSASGENRPSVVRLADPGRVMKMAPPPPRGAPELRFQDCLVRGQGDLVAAQPSRPLDLEVANAVVALDGCLLSVDGTIKEPPAASATSGVNHQVLTLANVTAYLTEPLLRLRAKEGGKGLVPTVVKKASDCLFVAAGGKNPLIQMDGLDSDMQMKRLISWEEGRHNAYMKFDKIIKSPLDYDADRWMKSDNINDPEAQFFDKGKKIDKPLSQVVPGDFREMAKDDAKMEVAKYGADLEALPRPAPLEVQEPE